MIEKFLETQNGKIYYWTDFISASNSTLIFLHGLSSNHTTWDGTLEMYKSAGFNLITVDCRGHGLSDKSRIRSLYTINKMKDDIVSIIKSEKLEKVILVGYSFGGYMCTDLTLHNPELVDKLVLISANHASPFLYHLLAPLNSLIRFVTNLLGWLLLWQSRKKYHYYNHAEALGYWQTTFSGLATMPLSINYWMLSEVFRMDYRKQIQDIKCPTLIVAGAGDNFITEREVNDMHKNIKDSKIVYVGAGHFVASHYQHDTANEIIKFLK